MNYNLSMKETVLVIKEKNGIKELVGRKKSFRERIGMVVVLTNELTGKKRIIEGIPNIVTTAGDKYYAEMACGQAPTLVFADISLCTAGPTPVVKASAWNDFTVYGDVDAVRAHPATYPLCPDVDPDNTGAGAAVISWKFEWTAADGPFVAIQWCFIAEAGADAGHAILQGYKWTAAWDKDIATSAKIFVNHTLLGS